MICIYHSKDLDGYASGAIVKRKYPDITMIGWDYKDAIPDFEQFRDQTVIMIDISFPIDKIDELRKIASHLTIVDHHISFLKEYDSKYHVLIDGAAESYTEVMHIGVENLTYIYKAGIAACEIGWKHFFPDQPTPEGIILLGEYDTWRKQDEKRWETRILPFQYGMRLICNSAETFPYDIIGPGGMGVVNSICRDGDTILKYQREQDKRLMHSSFVAEFEGLRALCVNVGGASSNTFLSKWDENVHDIMIPFHYTGSRWTCSIYTTKEDIDCSAIAKRLGGGGHRKASGFMLEKLPENFKR